jgi:hypothetical protein
MEIDTFRKWLAERGCHFDTRGHHRGEGHGHLTIHREWRTGELPLRKAPDQYLRLALPIPRRGAPSGAPRTVSQIVAFMIGDALTLQKQKAGDSDKP